MNIHNCITIASHFRLCRAQAEPIPSGEMTETVADRIKQARQLAGLSQLALADRAEVPQPVVSRLERGKQRGGKHLLAIAAACSVRLEWLQIGAGPMREGEAVDVPAVPKDPPLTEDERKLLNAWRAADHQKRAAVLLLLAPRVHQKTFTDAPPAADSGARPRRNVHVKEFPADAGIRPSSETKLTRKNERPSSASAPGERARKQGGVS